MEGRNFCQNYVNVYRVSCMNDDDDDYYYYYHYYYYIYIYLIIESKTMSMHELL